MSVRFLLNSTPSKDSKTLLLSETLMNVSDEQEEKAPSPIVVTLSGIVIDVSDKQEKNVQFPILVTLFGIVMDVSDEQ